MKQSLRFCVTVCVTGLKRRELQTTADSLSAVFKTPKFSSEPDRVVIPAWKLCPIATTSCSLCMAHGLPVKPVYLLVKDKTHCGVFFRQIRFWEHSGVVSLWGENSKIPIGRTSENLDRNESHWYHLVPALSCIWQSGKRWPKTDTGSSYCKYLNKDLWIPEAEVWKGKSLSLTLYWSLKLLYSEALRSAWCHWSHTSLSSAFGPYPVTWEKWL